MNPKDLEKEVQVLAMSFLVCTWQGHFPLPPGALVNVELPFVEYLLCTMLGAGTGGMMVYKKTFSVLTLMQLTV